MNYRKRVAQVRRFKLPFHLFVSVEKNRFVQLFIPQRIDPSKPFRLSAKAQGQSKGGCCFSELRHASVSKLNAQLRKVLEKQQRSSESLLLLGAKKVTGAGFSSIFLGGGGLRSAFRSSRLGPPLRAPSRSEPATKRNVENCRAIPRKI